METILRLDTIIYILYRAKDTSVGPGSWLSLNSLRYDLVKEYFLLLSLLIRAASGF